jgi:hypothetical protein
MGLCIGFIWLRIEASRKLLSRRAAQLTRNFLTGVETVSFVIKTLLHESVTEAMSYKGKSVLCLTLRTTPGKVYRRTDLQLQSVFFLSFGTRKI